jgi:hypothetical protein
VTVLTSIGSEIVAAPVIDGSATRTPCADSRRVSSDRIGTTTSNSSVEPSAFGASAMVRSPSTVGLSSSSPTG